jgi:hypothetical protein
MASVISAGTTSGTSLNLSGDTSGVLQLASNGSTTAVTIDTSQNVGIGTTSPTVKLDAVVTGNSLNSIVAARNTTSGTAAGSQILVGNDSSSDLLVLRALSSTYTSSGVNTANGSLIRGGGAGGMTLASTDGSGIIKFATGGTTERMRIDSVGRLLFGSTDTNPAVNNNPGVAIGANADNNFYAGVIQASATGNAALFLNRGADDGTTASFRRSGTAVGSISVTTSSTAYNTSSDYRLKENIAPMTGALAVVGQLKPCIYTWKADGSSGQGFIAHELQTVVPDAVCGEKDAIDKDGNPEYQGVDTSFLVATLTAAIQELNAKVEAQAVRIAELEGAK